MDDALIREARSPERESLLPGEGFFVPDSLEDRRARAAAVETLESADAVAVADPDADGLTCVALLRAAVGAVDLLPTGPNELREGLELVAEHAPAGASVFVCDLAPDTYAEIESPLGRLVERAGTVRWFDHHRWTDETIAAVREAGVDLTLGPSEDVCTADVVLDSLDRSMPEHLVELTAVARDHDLWLREDARSDDLADFAYWADEEEFIGTVIEHGPDLPDDVEAFLAERRVVKTDRIERAVRRAEFHDVGGLTVGLTYGRCSQNEVAERLRESGAAAAVIVKPAGSVSIRGTETFQRCHDVARLVGGGGHPKAAGCKPDIYGDMLDFAQHWTTQGATAKRVLLDAFRSVVTE